MSYDIAVIDRRQRFRTYKEFITWYENTVDQQGNDYRQTTPNLQQWFLELKDVIRPLNGEFSMSDAEIGRGMFPEADYGFGKEFIYVSLARTDCEKTTAIAFDLARKYHLAYFDISGNGSLYQDVVIDVFTNKIEKEISRRNVISSLVSGSILTVGIFCFSTMSLWGYCISGILLVAFVFSCIWINKWIKRAEQDIRADYDSSNQQL